MSDIHHFIMNALLGPSPQGRTLLAVALSIAAVIILVTRFVDKAASQAGPKAEPGGKSIVVEGKTYGLHTLALAGVNEDWVLSLPVGAPHTFSVQREDGYEKLIDHLGVMAKISTGSAHFDDEFEIRSHDEPWTRAFFTDPENRRLVQALFGLDATTVMLAGGKLQACFEENDALTEGAPALSELAARLPKA